jgi:hypothetical protein
MTIMEPPPAPVTAPPAPVPTAILPEPQTKRTNGHPPTTNGNGHGGHHGNGDGDHGGHSGGHEEPDDAPRPPKKRRSIWPFLLDLGLVMMLFGFIIIGRFLIVIGAVLFVVALTGWIREARSDFSGLAD